MVFSQAESELNDSLTIKDKLLNINKIRFGFDMLKPIKSSSDGDNLNYEIVGDLQITENLYLAAEYGMEICKQAIATHGGMGYAKEYHVERLFREMMIPYLAPVSQQLVLSYIAEKALGLPKSY